MKLIFKCLGVGLWILVSCGRDAGTLYVPVEVEQTTAPIVSLPPVQDEVFHLKELTANPIDVVWVVDNSGSMDEEIDNVKKNMYFFMGEFTKIKGADWKMGLISTEPHNDPFLGFTTPFDNKTIDPVTKFNDALHTLLYAEEEGYEKMCGPLSDKLTKYKTFMRKGAMLAIIMVTDEDEQSGHAVCINLINHLKREKGDLNNVLIYGIYGAYDMQCSSSASFDYHNSYYEQFVNSFPKKQLYSLCSPDFGKDLTKIGSDIVSYFEKKKLELKELADPATLEVFYKGAPLKGGLDGAWIYYPESNTIYFDNLEFAASDNETIEVKYQKRPVL